MTLNNLIEQEIERFDKAGLVTQRQIKTFLRSSLTRTVKKALEERDSYVIKTLKDKQSKGHELNTIIESLEADLWFQLEKLNH